ncbi:MAG: acetyl-CoA synthase subunit gamma [Spirochaetia bacterium]|nr:acetyl-CoA synthase subunit gamma [Spirochaetia bacterium]
MAEGCCGGSSCCGGTAVEHINGKLTGTDKWARWKFRLGISRNKYSVKPGLYALGSPGGDSPVLVSANFKLTFDELRSAMRGRDVWLLLLDTQGINVWCAAGKGSFGTEELIYRISNSGLTQRVNHTQLILPQLGAPGVKAHEVQGKTGFRVHYGPVSVKDLAAYLDAGLQAGPEMRRKSFRLAERLELMPLELVQSWKVVLGFSLVSVLLTALLGGISAVSLLYDVVPALLAVLGGACITPLLLPLIPGRAFSVKGALVGAVLAGGFIAVSSPPASVSLFAAAAVVGVSSFLGMNFTGASTFTSPSGVRREMRIALPLQLGLALTAVIGRVALEMGVV